MPRTLLAAAALAVVVGLVDSARAVCLDDAAHTIRSGYHRNEAWPWPFVCADRLAVRQPFCTMVHNGWRRQNLLGPHHFSADTGQLTTAGELRVQWILTQAPAERRSMYVERAVEPQVTQQRLAIVREYAAQWGIDGQAAQVWETHLVSEGRPAGVVDATHMRFRETMPPPTLPAATASFGASP